VCVCNVRAMAALVERGVFVCVCVDDGSMMPKMSNEAVVQVQKNGEKHSQGKKWCILSERDKGM